MAAVAREPFQLIVTDYHMPHMDGQGLVGFLKENPATAAVPVLMVTTETEKSRVIEAIRAGVNNYVVKPFTPELLLARVQETIDWAAQTGKDVVPDRNASAPGANDRHPAPRRLLRGPVRQQRR